MRPCHHLQAAVQSHSACLCLWWWYSSSQKEDDNCQAKVAFLGKSSIFCIEYCKCILLDEPTAQNFKRNWTSQDMLAFCWGQGDLDYHRQWADGFFHTVGHRPRRWDSIVRDSRRILTNVSFNDRQREAQGAKLRKAAEKLLLAHLKKRALDTLQAEQALEAAKSPPKKRSKKNPEAIAPPVQALQCSNSQSK